MNEAFDAIWSGRVDARDGEGGLRWHQLARPWTADAATGVTLLGLASDEGVRRNQGRVGAAAGPRALRRTLANLPAPTRFALHDAGDVACLDGDLEAAQAQYAEMGAVILRAGHLLVGLGGGHEIGWAGYRAFIDTPLARAPGARLGILNLDAHFDLREDERATSGTPFLQALDHAESHGIDLRYRCLGISETANTRVLFERAAARGVSWRRDDELTLATLDERARELSAWLAELDHLYLTMCMDVLPAAVAPGVSAPAARGVNLDVLEPLIRLVAASGKLRLADVAELAPNHDIDQRTARTAARLIWLIVRHHARHAE